MVHRNRPTAATLAKKPAFFVALAVMLAVVTLSAYFPACRGGFIFDDDVALTNNPLIQAADGLRLIWCSRQAADYWPVTASSFWLEWRLWGMNAAGYHVTNVVLHIATVLLFWALLRRLGAPGAFLAALLFALHPMNAASVAWITERKNLLALLFFLLSIYWFAGGKRGYWPSLLAFALAMLSKGSVVILPVVLVGLIVWHRRPTSGDYLRLTPFFLLAIGLAIVEAQSSTILAGTEVHSMGFLPRLIRAGGIIWFYLGKALWPSNLCFDYGLWTVRTQDPHWWVALGAAVLMSGVFWHYRRSWSRRVLFGWAYFGVALIPVMGFAEVGFMKYSPVANHYAHLALLGVTAGVGAAWARWAAVEAKETVRRLRSTLCIAAAAGLVVVLGCLTWQQSRSFAQPETLYRDTLARNPASWLAHTNLGVILFRAGDNTTAIAHLQTAVELKPDFAIARNDLGAALYRAERLADAMIQYEEALRLRPDYFEAHNNLGAALARSGRLPEAIAQFRTALQIEPNYREARLNLARAEAMIRPSP
jgi:protein O-mannosyl-transferase